LSQRRRGSAELGRAGSRSLEHRIGNTIFYVVAEGEGTEYDYLGWLNTTYGSTLKFLINTPPPRVQRNGLSPSRVVEHSCRRAREQDIDQVWGLFDHDGRNEIDQVCLREKPSRVSLVLSHPSFELWLLLHLREFTPGDRQYGRNGLIIDKLRGAHQAFADYGKRGNESTRLVLPLSRRVTASATRCVGHDRCRVTSPARCRASGTPQPRCTC
jgi:hypothetical protein